MTISPGRASPRRARAASTGSWLLALAVAVAPPAAPQDFAEDRESILRGLLPAPDAVANEAAPRSKSFVDRDAAPAPVARRLEVMRADGSEEGGAPLVRMIERRDDVASVNLKVEFDVDSDTLRPEARRLLVELGAALRDPRLLASEISINGHTDSSGPERYNLDLSYRRAGSVRDFLVESVGLDARRLVVQGFGESVPLSDDATPMQRQINRRVEIERLP